MQTEQPLPSSAARLLMIDTRSDELGCFFTDDSVFFLPPRIHPEKLADDVLCFSYRLGSNTTWCYPLNKAQTPPKPNEKGYLRWKWARGDGDFGYPGSLDGHVFRASHLRRMLMTAPAHANPNRIEEHLVKWCMTRVGREHPYMTADVQSSLVGVPINRVNDTHPNRYGEEHYAEPGELLDAYLQGERLEMPQIGLHPEDVRGAHQEIPLEFV